MLRIGFGGAFFDARGGGILIDRRRVGFFKVALEYSVPVKPSPFREPGCEPCFFLWENSDRLASMIATLRGEILEIEGRQIIIDVQGVGYQVTCTMVLVAALDVGKQAQITIYTEVKEDAIRLYGFSSKLEKQTFLLLTMVKGIGPKSAMDVISRVEARELLKLIAHGNLSTLKAVKGIGQKTAERIIVELKDKVAGFVLEQLGDAPSTALTSGGRADSQEGPNPFDDAHLALLALGFSRRDVDGVIATLQNGGVQYRDSGDIVRESLKQL